jgi:hypothetical protein
MAVQPKWERTDYQDMGVRVLAVEVAVGKREVGIRKAVEIGDTEATYIVVANLVVLQAAAALAQVVHLQVVQHLVGAHEASYHY